MNSIFVFIAKLFIFFRSEREEWKNKLVVENTDIKVHKLLASTENKIAGFNSSNQIDKLQGLLKDEPKKKGLLTGGNLNSFFLFKLYFI